MGRVPRERFVALGLSRQAYDDRAVGIGGGQTISQPYMVARMTELLDLPWWQHSNPGRRLRALDVGTGSGYQAAVLAEMSAEVISIERHEELAEAARSRLSEMGYGIEVVVGDGSQGWSPGAPYAGIVVGAAAPAVPTPLADQLAMEGRLVIPVGRPDLQWLTVVTRTENGFETREAEACVFVPLLGRYGFDDGEARF